MNWNIIYFSGYKIEKKNQKNIILIDVILCLPQTVNQSCQAPSLTYLKTNRVNVIDRNDIDEDEETEPTKIPNSTCIQSYSTYELDGHEPFLIPSGCKCHNIKYLWQNITLKMQITLLMVKNLSSNYLLPHSIQRK